MILSQLLQRPPAPQSRGFVLQDPALIAALEGGRSTSAGEKVDEDKALTLGAFWAAVNIIAGAVGYLPFVVYRRLPRGKERVDNSAVYGLIDERPNDYMTAQTFREVIQAHALTWGNGYAEIQYDRAGRAVALWPLMPDRVEPVIRNGKLFYAVRNVATGKTTELADWKVLHIPGLGYDGLKGYSVVKYHQETIGAGLGVRKYASRFFGSGASPSGVIRHPGQISKPAADRLRSEVENRISGLDNAHRVMVLEEAMEWVQMGVSPEDAQCLETQKFSVTDIARIFQIPPHMLGDLERATFSNIEHQGIQFVTMTLMRWLRKWEHECTYKLFGWNAGDGLFCEFVPEALLRGDAAGRAAFYTAMRNIGVLSANDIRAKENMNPVEGGDAYLIPLNMTDMAMPVAPPKPPQPPASPDSSLDDNGDDTSVLERKCRGFQPLLLDVCGQAVRREVKAVRGATDSERAAFYAKHAEFLSAKLAPACGALAAALGVDLPADYVEGLAVSYVTAARGMASEAELAERELNGAELLAGKILREIGLMAAGVQK